MCMCNPYVGQMRTCEGWGKGLGISGKRLKQGDPNGWMNGQLDRL
jgi:hypothetical protein